GQLLRARLRLIGRQFRLVDEPGEVLHQLTQHLLEITDSVAEYPQPFETAVKNPLLNGARRDEVKNGHFGAALSETVDTADPLLYAHRVPGNVVINQPVAELVIETLAADL